MYTWTKSIALRLMKAPTEPPEPPLGTHEDVQVFRASPKYLTYKLLAFWLISSMNWLILWVMLIAALGSGERGVLMLAIGLMLALAVLQFCFYFAVRIDYDMRYYIVTDRSLRVREGAFIVKEMTVSYANIQNIRLVQGPLLRLFGIRHLQVDTAGGGGNEQGKHHANAHRVQMAGIENAQEVRDLIQGHLKRWGSGAGLGDLDDADRHGAVNAARDGASRPMATSAGMRDALRELKQATATLRKTLGNDAPHTIE